MRDCTKNITQKRQIFVRFISRAIDLSAKMGHNLGDSQKGEQI